VSACSQNDDCYCYLVVQSKSHFICILCSINNAKECNESCSSHYKFNVYSMLVISIVNCWFYILLFLILLPQLWISFFFSITTSIKKNSNFPVSHNFNVIMAATIATAQHSFIFWWLHLFSNAFDFIIVDCKHKNAH
jgi:hypothetical protein